MSSSGIALAGGTKYWLVVSRTSLGGTGRMAISVVDAEEEFTDSVTGWSLGGYAFDQDNVADSIDWERVSSPSPLKAAILTEPTRTVAENATAGDVGAAVTATDADGDTLTYSVAATTDSDATEHLTAFNEDFGLDAAAGQITVRPGAVIDFETRSSYTVLYQVTDSEDAAGSHQDPPEADDTLTLTVTVTDVDEAESLVLSYDDPWVGVSVVAGLDGDREAITGLSWAWERSSDGATGWEAATGTLVGGNNLTSSYVPVDGDVGYFIRASASYTDGGGAKTVQAVSTAAVIAKLECASPANIVHPVLGNDGAPRGLWSDGRTLWVGMGSVGTVAAEQTNPIRPFALCAGTKLAEPGGRFAGHSRVNSMWAEGATVWALLLGDSTANVLRGYTMHPSRGWVRDTASDYAFDHFTGLVQRGVADGLTVAGSVMWVGSRNSGGGLASNVVLAYDWAGRPSGGGTLTPVPRLHLTRGVYFPEANSPRAVAVVGSDGEFLWAAGEAQYDVVRAFRIPGGDEGWERVTSKDIDLGDSPWILGEVWVGGGHAWVSSTDDDGVLDSRTGVFVRQLTLNSAPAFPDGDGDGLADLVSSTVAEGAVSGVLATVTATDDDTGDTLTYSVAATTDSDGTEHLTAFNEDFGLDAAAGQITVRPGAVIDFETRDTYTVLYQVTDGEDAAGEPSPAIDDSLTLTVTVTNANEAGAVSISGTAQVGAVLTATLADPDGAVSSQTWQWSRSDARSGPFADISGATSATYTPVAADDGKYLRAAVSYADVHGAGQSAEATTAAAVLAVAVVHTVPKFALDQGTEQVSTLDETSTSSTSVPTDHLAQSFATPGTVSDSFVLLGVRVALSVPAGQTAAASIWSNDASGFRELPGAVLPAGTLSATGAFDANVSTAEAFMSSSGIALAGGTKYWLVVSRTSLGGTGRMAISVVDAEEEFTDSVTGWSLGGYAFDQDNVADSIDWERVSSPSPLKAAILTEPTRTVAENTATGMVGDPVAATDSDGDVLAYSVSAVSASIADMAHLAAFSRDFALNAGSGQITVRPGAVIDFETRSSYRVLYRVSDGEDAAGEPSPAFDDMVTLTINVANENEPGAVTVSGVAQVGAVLTATLADPDGAVSSAVWQWSRAGSLSGSFADISGATSATYMPVAVDVGKYLKAAVTYTDSAHPGTRQGAEGTTAAAVRGTAPAFAAGAGLVDTAYVSSLGAAASNETDVPASRWAQMFTTGGTASDSFVVSGVRLPLGLPAGVSAMAEIFNNVIPTPNDSEPGSLFASLGGPPSFDAVTSTVEVFGSSPGVTLTGGTTYWVVITRVSGNSNDQIRIPLLDARAAFTDSATGWSLGDSAYYIGQVGNRPDRWDDYLGVVPWRIAIDYLAPRTVAENTASGGVGPAVTAIDADGDTLVYSVAVTSDADGTAHLEAFNRDFALDAMGQISVGAAAAIDYEARSSYTVLYQVSDGKNAAGEPSPAIDDTVTLTINVANENEPGAVTVSGVPQVGAELTASLADPDGAVSSAVWQWSRADSPSGGFNNIDGATSAAHTPVSDDVGKFLQAAATYTDDTHGAAGQSAAATTAAAVVVAEGTHTVPAFSDAVDTVYVSSLGAAASNDTDVPTSRWAQMFTTGGTASDSFVVSGVRLPLGLPAGVSATAEIFNNVIPAPNDSEPGSSFASLGGPPSFDADTSTVEVFGSSPGVTLTGGTTYWVVITRVSGNSNARIRIPLLDATGAFTDSATGWSLGDSAYYIGQVGNRPDRWDDPSGVTPLKMAILTGPTRTVTENTATGDVGLAVTATDLDGDTLTYSVAAVSASIADMAHLTAFSRDFALNAGSGQISVKDTAAIDYETRSSYTVLYRVTDGEDAAGGTESTPAFDDMVTLTINVANENEPGAVTVSGVPQVGAELTATLADPDGAVSSQTWQWSRAGSLSGSFADISGATSATYTAVDADAGMYLRATATYTDALGAQDQTAAATTDAAVTSAPKFALDQGTEQVSTLDETSTSSTSVPTDHLAQSFATPGTVSDSFVLLGVRVALSVPAGQTAAASIWSNDASGFRELPGAVLPAGTLSATGAFDANVSTAEAFMVVVGDRAGGGHEVLAGGFSDVFGRHRAYGHLCRRRRGGVHRFGHWLEPGRVRVRPGQRRRFHRLGTRLQPQSFEGGDPDRTDPHGGGERDGGRCRGGGHRHRRRRRHAHLFGGGHDRQRRDGAPDGVQRGLRPGCCCGPDHGEAGRGDRFRDPQQLHGAVSGHRQRGRGGRAVAGDRRLADADGHGDQRQRGGRRVDQRHRAGRRGADGDAG